MSLREEILAVIYAQLWGAGKTQITADWEAAIAPSIDALIAKHEKPANEWVMTSHRLPKKRDADMHGRVIAIEIERAVYDDPCIVHISNIKREPERFTFWSSWPQLENGEEQPGDCPFCGVQLTIDRYPPDGGSPEDYSISCEENDCELVYKVHIPTRAKAIAASKARAV